MRRVLKILAWLLAFIILLFLGGMVAIQSPKIQTALVQWAAGKLEQSFPADVTIGKLTVRPFDALLLEDVLLKDPQPYNPGMDTVIYVKNLTAKFSLQGLTGSGGIRIKRLKLDGGVFNLGYEPDPESLDGIAMNLYRVLNISESNNDDENAGWGKLLRARTVEVKNFRFSMANPVNAAEMEEEGSSYGEGVIDWNRFSVQVHEILATHVDVADNHIIGTVERLCAQETATGFTINEASAQHVDVGDACVKIEGLHLQAEDSDLYLNELVMDGPIYDYGEFIDRIWLDADIRPGSFISLPTVSFFSDGLADIGFQGMLQGQFHGYVNDFKLENIVVEDPVNQVRVQVAGRMKGLPDIDKTQLDFQVRKLDFGVDHLGGFIQAWSPDTRLDLSNIARGERFSFKGRVSGQLDRMLIKGDITSGIGDILADITLQGVVSDQPMVIGGRILTDKLDLGSITGAKALGPLTMRSRLEATFPRGDDMQVHIDTLNISRLHALGYDYTNLSAAGTYSEKAFDGRIIAADPNLNFLFQGLFNLSKKTQNAAYRFYASLGYADLHALHLDSREISKIRFQASSNFLRTEKRDVLGDILVTGIELENDSGRHNIGDMSIHALTNDNVSRIQLESSFLEGSYVGDEGPGTFLNDLQYLVLERDVPALLENKPEPWNGSTYNVALTVKSAQGLLSYLVPGLYIEKNTSMNLSINDEGLVTAAVRSGRLAFNDKFVKDFNLNFDNGNQVQTASVTGGQISLSGAQILDNRLTLFADDNQIGIGYTFDNGDEADTHAELYLSGDLSRDEDGLAIAARALPSNIYYKGNGWGLSSEEITFHGGDLAVNRLLARHNDETLLIHGGLSPNRADTLSIQMDKFDIGLVNSFSGSLPSLEGHATGHALVISPSSPSIGLLASIVCDSTYVSGHRMGQLMISSIWDEENGRFNANVKNLLGGKSTLDADAYLNPTTRAVHAAARLDKFNMGYAAPLLNSLFSEFQGYLSGEASVDGTLDKLHLSSRNLKIEDGTMALDYTRVPYRMEGDVTLDDEGLHFKKVNLADDAGGKGKITGSILMNGFQNIVLDTHVQISDLKVLDLPPGVNNLMYGTATATGRVDVTGPLNRIMLNVNAVSRAGEIHIGLGSGGGDRSTELLTFTEADDGIEEDPYEVMMAAGHIGKNQSSDFQVKLRIQATPDIQLYLDVDQESSLNAHGTGTVELETRSATGSFTMNGDYNISQGSFLFSAMNLVTRKFTIQDGSTIRFNGEVMNTDLDVHGLYTTKASLAALISDETAVSRRVVNCGIDITGRLSNPQLSFSIDVPDLNPATQAQVEGALNTVDKVQKQFVYLLIAGSFLPGEESGITTSGTDALFSNVSSIMSGQINNIFQKLDIPLDMGLNYQTTQAGSNLFDVALSTQLFNNRVIVNGTVGNKQMLGGVSTNEVAGDIDIEIKLNRSGSVRVKLFSHSADQYTAYLDNSQRHGGGISYQRDFNSLRQLFRMLFSSRKEREEMANREVLEGTRSVVLTVDEHGKTHQE